MLTVDLGHGGHHHAHPMVGNHLLNEGPIEIRGTFQRLQTDPHPMPSHGAMTHAPWHPDSRNWP